MDYQNIRFIQKIIGLLKPYSFGEDVKVFIACQFALESSFGRSKLAITHHNYCGMKTPLIRISTAENAGKRSESDNWARYFDIAACVCDYVLCLQYYKPHFNEVADLDSFKSLIRGKYCPDKDYLDKINSIYQLFKSSSK